MPSCSSLPQGVVHYRPDHQRERRQDGQLMAGFRRGQRNGPDTRPQPMKDVRMSKLFSPTRIGAIDLSHRVVLAPLTRMRADVPGNVPGDLMATYYGQRASGAG